jgi:hypothetical protein
VTVFEGYSLWAVADTHANPSAIATYNAFRHTIFSLPIALLFWVGLA